MPARLAEDARVALPVVTAPQVLFKLVLHIPGEGLLVRLPDQTSEVGEVVVHNAPEQGVLRTAETKGRRRRGCSEDHARRTVRDPGRARPAKSLGPCTRPPAVRGSTELAEVRRTDGGRRVELGYAAEQPAIRIRKSGQMAGR